MAMLDPGLTRPSSAGNFLSLSCGNHCHVFFVLGLDVHNKMTARGVLRCCICGLVFRGKVCKVLPSSFITVFFFFFAFLSRV
jgi:hypothetical protein